MVNSTFKRIVSPVLDPLGNALLVSRAASIGHSYRHGPRTLMRIALTFDDGPSLGGTEAVLDTLDEFGVLGTFFCVGANTKMHPEVVRRAYSSGHIIGAHSMNHGRTGAVSLTDGSHIDDCLREIRRVTGRTPALYRPPWGWLTPWEMLRLRQRGLEVIQWDIETPDSDVPCPDGAYMAKWALSKAQPGTILVFHDGNPHADRYEKPETVRALRLLIPDLRSNGYEFVTIPHLLDVPAYLS